MNRRTIRSSKREVVTIEEKQCFWVYHKSHGYTCAASGPFGLKDKRFSNPLFSEKKS